LYDWPKADLVFSEHESREIAYRKSRVDHAAMNAYAESTPPEGTIKPQGKTKRRFVWHVAPVLGASIVQQAIGLLRQMLVAAFFGLSREYDGYIVVYGLVSMIVFILAGVSDTVVVSRLVQIRERDGEAAFWRTSNRLLLQALAADAILATSFMMLLWLAMPVVAAGFTPVERTFVFHLGFYFLPWIVIVIPYYALCAHLKARWQFFWVFGAENVTIAVSIVVLWFSHATVMSLPIAYAAGYGAATAILLTRRGIRAAGDAAPLPGLMASMTKQYAAMQVGTVTGLAERYFQSFLLAGGISALGYVGLIVNNLASLLTFREIYVVPLATEAGREQKLERILQGLVLVSIPCVLFLVVYAEPIVSVLLQRGKFTAEAVAVTASVLRILALSLFVSTLHAPLERIFQIVDRLSLTQIRYVAAFVGTVFFQYLFVFYLRMDVRGVAWGWVCNGIFVLPLTIWMVRRCDVVIRWRGILANIAFAAFTAGAAMAISWQLGSRFTGLTQLAIGGGTYGLVVALSYLAARARLRTIIG
jgi:putative peptidoglycan lipid II flippase